MQYHVLTMLGNPDWHSTANLLSYHSNSSFELQEVIKAFYYCIVTGDTV